ncbi:MAG TPA: tyrosine-type recombinase/integrase [Polaromonas sp.]|uniref:tyrosine-type recombinase/integrase n=1 Tax=Polaromonas sp. TaxID=1869339 RepID=UPI002D226FA9|nr:tyrosine-type recombinase/integrase [Polaromonas sp.]HYW58498.1 tyrosine-type recombinase/integrase [Polaromonas sp.]
MTTITDRAMQASPKEADQWITQPFKRGTGVFLGRITSTGERLFYFRYTDSKGKRPFLPIGNYHPKGKAGGLTLALAYKRAAELSTLYQTGVHDLREHFIEIEAQKAFAVETTKQELAAAKVAEELAIRQRITVKALFNQWAEVELQPHTTKEGKRVGRKDGGQYTKEQFERRVFGPIGDKEAKLVTKADIFKILDDTKKAGKLRTGNVLLADLKQMFQFALAREIINRNPLDTITKRQVGGANVVRKRNLEEPEIRALATGLKKAGMTRRGEIAVKLILATCCRISELMGATWEHIDLEASTWHLPETKNQRPHTIHLSPYAKQLFQQLLELRNSDSRQSGKLLPWVFPNKSRNGAVCIKSFGKQLSDRQRPAEQQMTNRTHSTTALLLPGGHWTAHDLRRSGSTVMAKHGVSTDVIDECLNHMIASQMGRVYIQDRRLDQQAAAFNLLGEKLAEWIPV